MYFVTAEVAEERGGKAKRSGGKTRRSRAKVPGTRLETMNAERLLP
jgi:hypothetical protein